MLIHSELIQVYNLIVIAKCEIWIKKLKSQICITLNNYFNKYF